MMEPLPQPATPQGGRGAVMPTTWGTQSRLTKGDLQWLGRAVVKGWPIPNEQREAIIARLKAEYATATPFFKERLGAVFLLMNATNTRAHAELAQVMAELNRTSAPA